MGQDRSVRSRGKPGLWTVVTSCEIGGFLRILSVIYFLHTYTYGGYTEDLVLKNSSSWKGTVDWTYRWEEFLFFS